MSEPRFEAGDWVRVRKGVVDPDYPDFPLGGWRGVVIEVHAEDEVPVYLIEWDEETVEEAHEAYFNRAEYDDSDPDEFLVSEKDLEPGDPDAPLRLEQPTNLVPRPLNLDVPEERILSILGWTCDDGFPEPDEETFDLCHEYFSRTLKFPFAAGIDLGKGEFGSNLRPALVRRLLPVEEADDETGLLVEITHEDSSFPMPLIGIHLPETDPNYADLQAYRQWIEEHVTLPLGPLGPRPLLPILFKIGISLVLGCGVVGAGLATVPGAFWGAIIGAVLLAFLGLFTVNRGEAITRDSSRFAPRSLVGGFVGFLVGVGTGATIGTLLVTFYAAIPGATLGTLLGKFLLRRKTIGLSLLWPYVGALLGTLAMALWFDWNEALVGTAWGLLAGAVGAAIALGCAFLVLRSAARSLQ